MLCLLLATYRLFRIWAVVKTFYMLKKVTVQYNCTTITKNGYTMCRTNEIFDMENIIFCRLCLAVCALWTMQNSIPGPLP